MNSPEKRVHRSLILPLAAAVVSWGLILGAVYSDATYWYSPDGVSQPDPGYRLSTWFFFGAIAVFAVASLFAQRLAIAARTEPGPHARLARASHRFANLAIIIALSFAVIFAISGFGIAFFEGSGSDANPGLRILNVYGPIILYTVLVVWVLLAAFVLRKRTTFAPIEATPAATLNDDSDDENQDARRSLGFAYAAPIVVAAVGLIIGLIVTDVTGSAPEAWVWVIIQLLIGAGVVAGTLLARRALAAEGETAAGRGASGLNFALSIVFGVVVTMMSFGYGATAVQSLMSTPNLSLDVYANSKLDDSSSIEPSMSVNGYGLASGSKVTVVVGSGDLIDAGTVDSQGYVYWQDALDVPSTARDIDVTATGTAPGNREIVATLTVTVDDDGALDIPDGYANATETLPPSLTPTPEWVVRDLLPALALLLLAAGVVYATLVARNRRG